MLTEYAYVVVTLLEEISFSLFLDNNLETGRNKCLKSKNK